MVKGKEVKQVNAAGQFLSERNLYEGTRRTKSDRELLVGREPGDRLVQPIPSQSTTGKVRILRKLPLLELVGDLIDFPVAEIQGGRLCSVERPRATPAKDGNLVAGFVHRALAVHAPRNRQRRAFRLSGGDQSWCGSGAETGKMSGVVPGRNDLQDAEAVGTI